MYIVALSRCQGNQGYGKDWVELDVNTKRDPPEKYNLHAQTNLKMHVEVFYPL